jgi:gentisate 1,2-dioxygenase
MGEKYITSYEYESNVNPKLISIPIYKKSIDDCDYGINSIDLSYVYNIEYKATSPNLLASFIKIKGNDNINFLDIDKNKNKNENENEYFDAGSHFFYIIKGCCSIYVNDYPYALFEGDIFISPMCKSLKIVNDINEDLNIYYINDSPLINYLGCKPFKPTFKCAKYSKDYLNNQLHNLSNPLNNRKGILLSNKDTEKIGVNTITPILWSLYNELPPHNNQKPHKHNSVALDLCIQSLEPENIYTLVGDELDLDGNIINPVKINWKSGEMFITPPGLWHSHHNIGNTFACILPIQDAGLLLYQRILGITLIH